MLRRHLTVLEGEVQERTQNGARYQYLSPVVFSGERGRPRYHVTREQILVLR